MSDNNIFIHDKRYWALARPARRRVERMLKKGFTLEEALEAEKVVINKKQNERDKI